MKRLFIVLCLAWASMAAAGPQLDEGDVLTLRVAGMADVSGDWPVGPGRSLTIPGLGRLDDIGDVEQVNARLAAVIAERLGGPGVSFSLVVRSYRPVLVAGAVASPGPVAYRPGMRLIEAAAMAGAAGGGDLSRQIAFQQERERLLQAETRLARALAREARLRAEMAGQAFDTPSLPEVETLLGAEGARGLVETENRIATTRSEIRVVALGRIDSSLTIGAEDITAQEAVNASLEQQLVLVRDNLVKLQPLFDTGSLTGARILELRRDFVDIEGRVGEARATLAKARAGQEVLSEEREAFDLSIRLELLEQLIETQFQIAEARVSQDTAATALSGTGLSVSGAGELPGDCRTTILRRQADGSPELIAAEAMTEVLPGDFVQIGRMTRACPQLLLLGEAGP